MKKKRVCIDVGGTFTDCLVMDETGLLQKFKASTTPSDPSTGLMNAMKKAARHYGADVGKFLGQIEVLVHGTTLATNILLTGRGAKAGMITTKGFRDSIEIRRGIKPVDVSLYNLFIPPNRPLIPRSRRIGVEERTLFDGSIMTPLNEQDVVDAVKKLKAQGVESIAVCFLHSYANPKHEQRAAEICREVAPDIFVSTSHETLPVWREFERFNTTTVGSYVGPAVAHYLTSLEKVLKDSGFRGTFLMMLANGLVQNIAECIRRPVFLLHSGPAAAPSGAVYLGRHLEEKNLLSVDMGGTSFDVCVVDKGEIPTTTEHWENDQRVAIKMVDIASIGAGGGSMAKIDSLGLLRVGPAECRRRSGPGLLRDRCRRDRDRRQPDPGLRSGRLFSRRRNETGRRGITPGDEAADGTATPGREGGGRIHLPHRQRQYGQQDHRGVDQARLRYPRHCHDRRRRRRTDPCRLHRRQSWYPQGRGSASRGSLQRLRHVRHGHRPGLRPLVCQPRRHRRHRKRSTASTQSWKPRRMPPSGRMACNPKDVVLKRSADLRYVGQFHEVEIDIADGKITRAMVEAAAAAFARKHEELYTFAMPWKAVEILTLRLKASTPNAPFACRKSRKATPIRKRAFKRRRTCRFNGQRCRYPIYDGEKVLAGNVITGPAIIEETTTTVVIPEAYVCSVDKYKNYILTRR